MSQTYPVADPLTRHIIGKYCLPTDWFDLRKKAPQFVSEDGKLMVLNVRVRHSDGTEEDTIYSGFGHFGYYPFMTDVTHWQIRQPPVLEN